MESSRGSGVLDGECAAHISRQANPSNTHQPTRTLQVGLALCAADTQADRRIDRKLQDSEGCIE